MKICINHANVLNGDVAMSQNHGIKGGTTDEAFQAHQEQCFLDEG